MKVLMLLIESGAIYCVILASLCPRLLAHSTDRPSGRAYTPVMYQQSTALASNIVSRTKDASSTPGGAAATFVSVTTVFLSGCFVPVLVSFFSPKRCESMYLGTGY